MCPGLATVCSRVGNNYSDPHPPCGKQVKAALAAALSPAVAVMCEDSSPTGPPRWADAAPGAGAGEEVRAVTTLLGSVSRGCPL